MANKKLKYVYCDSCFFLSYFSKTLERIADIEGVLKEAKSGKYKLVTSTISITEVAFTTLEKDLKALDGDSIMRMDELWCNDDVLELVEFSDYIARSARQLLRYVMANKPATELKRFTPNDAIHLATVKWFTDNGLETPEFFTYDEAIIRTFGILCGVHASKPHILQPTLLDIN